MPRKSPVRSGVPTVAEAIAEMQKARASGRGRHSPLYVWLRENHDALLVEFAKSAPAWTVLAAYLGEHGIRDGGAKLPTARGARDAWWRVRKDVIAAMARQPGQAVGELEPGETVPDVRAMPDPAVAPATNSAEGSEDLDGPAPRTFRMATLRGHTPSPVQPSSRPAPPIEDKPASAQVQDPDEVISRLLGRSGSNPRSEREENDSDDANADG